jgi:hypothetical protein
MTMCKIEIDPLDQNLLLQLVELMHPLQQFVLNLPLLLEHRYLQLQ